MNTLCLPEGLLRGDGILGVPGTKYSFHANKKLTLLPTRMVKVQIPRLSVSEIYGVESVVNLLGITPVFNQAAISSVAMEDTAQKSFKVRSPPSAAPVSVLVKQGRGAAQV